MKYLVTVLAAASITSRSVAGDASSPTPAELGFRDVLAPLAESSTEASQPPPRSTSKEVNAAESEPPGRTLFTSPYDGWFDASGFLATRTGFLPIAIPITEPAVGYGLAIGLTFFHGEPKPASSSGGQPRMIMPSTTVVMGAATENGTWATGLAHLGVWNDGKIRYVGAAGYASLNLDWYGKGDAFGGNSFAYTNEVLFVTQNIKFQIEGTDLFIGPTYRFIESDSRFNNGGTGTGILNGNLHSQTSGLGVEFSYDSLDHPYAPTKGFRGNLRYTQHGEWIGGDFNYAQIDAFAIGYVPLADNVFLGLKLNADYVSDDSPFYDLSAIIVRGLDRARYMDNVAVYGEAELRWDIDRRWSLIGFGGGGAIASDFPKLELDEAHWAGGGGFRYLLAERLGLRLGVDLAYGDDKWTVYIGIGTGWIRP